MENVGLELIQECMGLARHFVVHPLQVAQARKQLQGANGQARDRNSLDDFILAQPIGHKGKNANSHPCPDQRPRKKMGADLSSSNHLRIIPTGDKQDAI